MSKFWLRKAKLKVDDAEFECEFGSDESKELRIRFNVVQMANQTPTYADIIVTNPDPKKAQDIATKQSQKLTLEVGYSSMQEAIVFEGTTVQAIYGREDPTDTILKIHAVCADLPYSHAAVNKTFEAGSTGQDIFDECLKAMKPWGIKEGYVTKKLKELKFPTAVTIQGDAKDYLRTLAQAPEVNAQWHIDGKDLDMVGLNEVKGQDVVVLGADSGLVGMPEQTFQGIMVRSLINPDIHLNSLIKVDVKSVQEATWDFGEGGTPYPTPGGGPSGSNLQIPSIAADGVYKVLQIITYGDTFGNVWYMDLTCLAYSNGGVTGAVPDSLTGVQGVVLGTSS